MPPQSDFDNALRLEEKRVVDVAQRVVCAELDTRISVREIIAQNALTSLQGYIINTVIVLQSLAPESDNRHKQNRELYVFSHKITNYIPVPTRIVNAFSVLVIRIDGKRLEFERIRTGKVVTVQSLPLVHKEPTNNLTVSNDVLYIRKVLYILSHRCPSSRTSA